eukprot:m.123159 g.123159  ORF g.123159 m.123159 type:complete len:1084 (-) comp15673_c0_seq1:32-3283(-)
MDLRMAVNQDCTQNRKSYSQAAAVAKTTRSTRASAVSSRSSPASTPYATQRSSRSQSPKQIALDAEAIQQRLRQEGLDARNLVAYSVPVHEPSTSLEAAEQEGFTVVKSKRTRHQQRRNKQRQSQPSRPKRSSQHRRVANQTTPATQTSLPTDILTTESRLAHKTRSGSSSTSSTTITPSVVAVQATSAWHVDDGIVERSYADTAAALNQLETPASASVDKERDSVRPLSNSRHPLASSKSFDRLSLDGDFRPSTPGQTRRPELLRSRYWSYMLEQLHRAVDDLYKACEEDASDDQCREVTLILDGAKNDFEALIDRFRVLAEAAVSVKPMAMAWNVRKSTRPSPAPSLMSSLNSNFGMMLPRPLSARSAASSLQYDDYESVAETPDVLELPDDESDVSASQSLNSSFFEQVPDGASWAYDQDSWLADVQTRAPGSGAIKHDRLSSPGRKRPAHESARRAAVRQERATANRKQLQQAQDERLQRHNERITGTIERRQKSGERMKQTLQHKQLKAEELRQTHLQGVREKGRLEEQKKQEILFIQKLGQANLKMEVLEKESLEQARLEQLSAQRRRKAEEKAARDLAVLQRKKAIEEKRMERLRQSEERRQARLAAHKAELASQTAVRRASPRKSVSRPVSAGAPSALSLLTQHFQYPELGGELAKSNRQQLKKLRARAKKLRRSRQGELKSMQLQARAKLAQEALDAGNSKELAKHLPVLVRVMKKSGFEKGTLPLMALVLQTWMSQPKVVSLDALSSTCSVIEAVINCIPLASKTISQPSQLDDLLSPLLQGDVHIWLDALTNMLRAAQTVPVYLSLAQEIVHAVSTMLRVCFDVHRQIPLPPVVIARLKDISSHLLLSNYCTAAQAVCAFAATQDELSLCLAPVPFVQLQLNALMLDTVLGEQNMGLKMLELPNGMATMVHWAASSVVSAECKQDVVAIASRVATVSNSMATAWLCHHDNYRMAALAVESLESKHASYSFGMLQGLARASPSHRQAFGRAGLIERLCQVEMDSLKPLHKENLVMLNVWLGYDEGNLDRMKRAIGDVTWLYPAIDRFGARLGSGEEQHDLKEFYRSVASKTSS